MKFTAKQYAEALFESLREVRPKDQDRVLDNFVKVLAEYGDLKAYDEISKEYQKLEEHAQSIKQVEVTTANPAHSKALLAELNRIVGDKIELKEKIDQSIIGGIVVRVDDTLIDASIKNNLNQLRKQIIS